LQRIRIFWIKKDALFIGTKEEEIDIWTWTFVPHGGWFPHLNEMESIQMDYNRALTNKFVFIRFSFPSPACLIIFEINELQFSFHFAPPRLRWLGYANLKLKPHAFFEYFSPKYK